MKTEADLLWSWTVTPIENEENHRVDHLVVVAYNRKLGQSQGTHLPAEISRNQIKKLIQDGRVKVRGSVIKPNRKLKEGELVEVLFQPLKPLDVIPQDIPIDIMFEDEHIIVVNKQPGLTVHPSETQTDGTLVNALLFHIKKLSGIGGVLRPGIVHRLDKFTSGTMVVTKSDEAHHRLSETFSEHKIDRAYWALCYGASEVSSQTVESTIGRNPNDRKKMAANVKGGKQATTHLKLVKEFALPGTRPFASLVEAKLETGRTHQVRVHLAETGNSVMGDPQYGVPSNKHTKWKAVPQEVQKLIKDLPGQALHARLLRFKHPITGKEMTFESNPPAEFQNLLTELDKWSGGQ